jgi:hypothetical protein
MRRVTSDSKMGRQLNSQKFNVTGKVYPHHSQRQIDRAAKQLAKRKDKEIQYVQTS